MKLRLALAVFAAMVVFAAWLQLTDRYDFEMAWRQGTIFYNPGVRDIATMPR